MSTSASSSSANNDYFFGWDLLYKTIDSVVNKKSDILIALAHFVLIKHSNFRCIGIGEDKTLSEDESGSELMPDGWNNDDNKYALRYMHDGKLYLMLGHITEGTLIINLLNVETKQVSNIGLDPDETVKKTKGRISDLIPNTSHITDRYRRELVEPVFAGTTREASTITTSTATSTTSPQRDTRSDPLRIGEPRRPLGGFIPGAMEPRPFGFPDVGRGDLDPLGRGAPGNLFPFPTRPDFPGSGQPRFDPFGPPERGVRPNPNPDHLQPPNFGGPDYYM